MKRTVTIWFRAKRYGWGWQPTSWQGWVILAIYICALITIFLTIDARSHSESDTLINFAPFFIVASIIFLAICYKKGEKLGWRWGDKK